MNKSKKIFGVISIVIIIALGLAGYYYFVFDERNPETGEKLGFREFLPFGRNGEEAEFEQEPENNNFGTTTDELPAFTDTTLTLSKISRSPIAGYVPLETASGTAVRYTERATGHVYSFNSTTGETGRVTNTTVPRVREAVWSPDGKSVVLRYLKEGNQSIESRYGTIVASSTNEVSVLQDGLLASDIKDAVILQSGKLFTLTEGISGAIGTISNIDGSAGKTVFKSSVREWLSQPVGTETIALTTKPASYTDGYLYLLNVRTGAFTKITGGRGFTANVSPDGRYALFSDNSDTMTLKVYDSKSNKSETLGFVTLPEKCVWKRDSTRAYCAAPKTGSMNADYLDLWLQGIVSQSDNIWYFIPEQNQVELVHTLQEESIDAVNLQLSAEHDKLMFVNRKDSYLWMLDLDKLLDLEEGE